MADLIVSPLVEYLFEKLTSKAEDAINVYLQKKEKRKELPKTIQKWKKKLRDIAKVLSDAEQKRSDDESIEEWLKDLQDWAYDLEDLLDEFATDARLNECYPELHEEEDDSPPFCKCFPRSKVPSFLPCVSRASDLNNDAYVTRIEEISNRLDAILERVETLGLLKQKPSREERQQEQRVGTTCIAPRVFGRTKEKQLIIDRLLVDESYNHENYAVIPIVGKGGVGKTTLIQSVYNDEKLKGHFEVTAWVCVSDVFDIKRITTSIITSANANCASSTFNNLNEAQNKLREILSGKRFLIALDDVWNDEYNFWEQLQLPFKMGCKGSKVLVTTRLESVAKNMLTTRDQNSIVHVDCLSNEECWLIFKEHALISDDPVVIETRDEVIKLCKGLPLAAKALGGLLKKHTRSNWSTILSSSSMWREEGGVLPALRLSYYHLPQHLKRVFAYCSVFPQDHLFDKEEMVLMWMAEGFLPESEEESMEDKGNSYFDDLVSRSLLEQGSSFFGYFFIMHDLINDLAHWAAGDVCCRMKINNKGPFRTRYLCVTREVYDQDPSFLANVGDAGRQLRSYVNLSRSQSKVLESSILQFQCLRVLYLASMGFTKLPNSIGNLKHLRFLDLSYSWRLNHLPESMSKLCNLQTLLLNRCQMLKKLFDMSFLSELRHLNIQKTKQLDEMPRGFGKLRSLRTLTDQYKLTDNSGPRIRELENLKYLSGSLYINGVQFVKSEEDAKMAKLHEKSHLEDVTFCYFYNNPEADYSLQRGVLNQLQPPNSIKKLTLSYYKASAFPNWLGDPSFNMMVVIKLDYCSRCERLPPLGQLPSLKHLHLENLAGIKTVGLEFYGTGCINPFPTLKTIEFTLLKNWDAWVHPSKENSSRAFPLLEEIYISSCPLLRGNIPSNLPSLKELSILETPEMKVSLPSCPLLQKLTIVDCRELSSIKPVIFCSTSVDLNTISSISGVEGFCVPDVVSITIADGYSTHTIPMFDKTQQPPQPYIALVGRSKLLLSWRPQVYGEFHKLTHVKVSNCELLVLWFKNESVPSVKHLEIEGDNEILNDVSTVTKPFTCLESLKISNCKALRITANNYLPLTLRKLITANNYLPLTLRKLITANNYLPLTLRKLILFRVEIEQPAKEWGFDRILSSLKHLVISNVGSCGDAVESIPNDLPLPSSLVTLTIMGFKNLKSFSCSTLHNLSFLDIIDCPLMSEECVYVDGGQCKLQLLQVR